MMTRTPLTSHRRGAVLIIVIAMLGVIALLIVTLSYGTRVDYMASRNWANSVQSRMAAASDLPVFAPAGGNANGLTPLSSAHPALASATPSKETLVTSADGYRELAPVPIQLQPVRSSRYGTRLQSAAFGSGQVTTMTLTGGLMADVTVADTSAKLNINAIVPKTGNQTTKATQTPAGYIGEADLAALITAVMESSGISGVDAEALAHKIAIRRYGKDGLPGYANEDDNDNGKSSTRQTGLAATGITADHLDNDRDGKLDNKEESIERDGIDNNFNGQIDEPGEGIDEPAESLSDPRLEPNGDDTPYASLTELMAVPGMTTQLYMALAPRLTVFSVSYAAFQLPEQNGSTQIIGWPQLDPNTAPPELIHATLKQRFPSADPAVLGQFTANLLDRRDRDSVPGEIELDGVKYRGQELTPYINEACTGNLGVISKKQARRGQFVEIINPFSKTRLDVEGWTLTGAGADIPLSGTIEPGGYLIVTDDYNDQSDPNRGRVPDSFFSNFGVVSSGSDQVILEDIALDLLAGNGRLELKDDKGNVIDTFEYDPSARTGMNLSFQKIDPRLNVVRTERPTPLGPNSKAQDDGILTKQAKLALQTMERTANMPMRTPFDVMLVGTAHLGKAAKSAGENAKSWPWQLPELGSADTHQLDIRLVDCFLPGVEMPMKKSGPASSFTSSEKSSNEIIQQKPTPVAAAINGRININTASIGVLAALPGMSSRMLTSIREARMPQASGSTIKPVSSRDKTYWRESDPRMGARWANISDFMLDNDVWGETSLYDRLNQAYPFSALIGTHSLSMVATSTTKPSPTSSNKREAARRQNVNRAERLLAADRGMVETVNFKFVGTTADSAGDPDQRNAMKLSSAKGLMLFPPSQLSKAMGRTKKTVARN